jgi:peptidyl-prolyl cis-trans isomerase A (cyclophilin A)
MKVSLPTFAARSSVTSNSLAISALLVTTFTCVVACESSPPEPSSQPQPQTRPSSESTPPQLKTAASPQSASQSGDPVGGQFSLAQATLGLPKTGKLTATIDTDLGALKCELFEDKAPITVANFVGLARGLRPFMHDGTWHKKPAYDGTTFHRVIKGFMIQGGDPSGNGSGEPGYVIPDEKWEGAKHDRRGLLCMANRGPDTNGMQFFITDEAAPHLDRSYTIFGQCSPDQLIEKLASVETYGTKGQPGQPRDRPLQPPKIKTITVTRK